MTTVAIFPENFDVPPRPNRFFGVKEQARLQDLMERWHLLRDQGKHLDASEQSELSALVEAEVKAAAERADALADALTP